MLTIAEVLALPVLAAGAPQVRAGHDRLDTPVRWIHVLEQVDVAALLEGGELLLSTGMGLTATGFDASGYVSSLVDAGAAGLVVELGEHLAELPRSLVQAARAVELPLVELHRVVRFVEVTERVHGVLLHEQHERLRFAERVHATFASLALVQTSTQEVLDRAASLVAGPVVLEDLAHRAVAHAAHHLGTGDVLTDWTRRSRRENGTEGWVVVAAGSPGDRWGRLIAPGPGVDQDVHLVLERAAEVLTVLRLLAGETAEDGLVTRAHDDLVRDLLRARAVDETTLRHRLRALGLPTRGGFAAAAVHGAERVTVSQALEGALADLRCAGLTGMIGAGSGDPVVGVLLVGSAQATTELLPRLAAALPAVATLGTAPAVSELHAAGQGFTEARHVAQVAATLPDRRPGTVHRTGDLGVRGLLWRLRGDARLTEFAEAELAPLLETGHRGGGGEGDLELLGEYLAVNGSMTRLAQRLHLSRPATYGRVERLARRLGRNLEDAEVRTTLHLALLART